MCGAGFVFFFCLLFFLNNSHCKSLLKENFSSYQVFLVPGCYFLLLFCSVFHVFDLFHRFDPILIWMTNKKKKFLPQWQKSVSKAKSHTLDSFSCSFYTWLILEVWRKRARTSLGFLSLGALPCLLECWWSFPVQRDPVWPLTLDREQTLRRQALQARKVTGIQAHWETPRTSLRGLRTSSFPLSISRKLHVQSACSSIFQLDIRAVYSYCTSVL